MIGRSPRLWRSLIPSFEFIWVLYDLAILILGMAWLLKIFSGKYQQSVKQRLGLVVPKLDPNKRGPVIWIHAVSVGETKAAAALIAEIRKDHPKTRIVLSSITETGYAEAKRSIPDLEAQFYLPLDLSWIMQRFFHALKPSALLLVEGEFWYNLLHEAKKNGCKVALVNGKLSERSAKRFSQIPWFTKKLFEPFDVLCLQTDEYKKAFQSIGIPSEKLSVTGNFKFDLKTVSMTPDDKKAFKNQLCVSDNDFVLVLASTHEGEESALLEVIEPLLTTLPNLKILLVPRHPDRFDAVEKLLQKIPYSRFTATPSQEARCILIDTMGILTKCYQIADVAVVCGSFIPDIGGHNLFEAAACGIPVLFGPYTTDQKASADALTASSGGFQLSLKDLPETILNLYKNPTFRTSMGLFAKALSEEQKGSAKKTLKILVANSVA